MNIMVFQIIYDEFMNTASPSQSNQVYERNEPFTKWLSYLFQMLDTHRRFASDYNHLKQFYILVIEQDVTQGQFLSRV